MTVGRVYGDARTNRMCGRFTLRSLLAALVEQFDLELHGEHQLPLYELRYNIAPTQDVLVIRQDTAGGGRRVDAMRWGLLPSWGDGPKTVGPPIINARAETLAEKPMFRTAVRWQRCLIPADGFFEWQQSASSSRGKKPAYFVHRPDDRPFAFAGLWERWTQRKGSGDDTGPALTIDSCVIVTTQANATLRELHERMPVVLAPNDYALWLDAKVDDPAAVKHLLEPAGEDELVVEPVGTYVNKVANDDPRCVAVDRTLF